MKEQQIKKKVVLRPPTKNDNPKLKNTTTKNTKNNKKKQAGAESVNTTSVKSRKITEMFQRVTRKSEPETLNDIKNQPESKITREKEPDLSLLNQDTDCTLPNSSLNFFKLETNPDLEAMKVTKNICLPELVIGPDESGDQPEVLE